MRHKIITALVIIVLAGGGYFLYTKMQSTASAQTRYVTSTVKKQTIVSSVSGTGQVLALNQIDIKPATGSTQSANTVTSVNVQAGQEVKVGQIIATLDQKNALLAINQAKASLASAQANLDSLLAGPTALDLQASQNSVNSAQLSLANAQRNLVNTKTQQQTTVNNALKNLLNTDTDAIPGPTNSSSDGTPTISGSYGGTAQGNYIIRIYNSDAGLQFSVDGLESGGGYINTTSVQPLGTQGLYIVFSNPDSVKAGDNWTVMIPNVQANGYLSNYNAYQTALQNQTQALVSGQASIDSAQANLDQAKNSLAQKQQPATDAQIATAKSQVNTAQASLDTAQNNYNNDIITAPFDGQIAVLGVQKGDQINSATVLATLVTKQKLVQVSLNEVDVAKVKVGEQATLTFDAIPDLTLTGKVTEVDIIGAVSQGVVNYNVQIGLDSQDDRIKPSMSASADIITEVRQDIIAVPSGAVKTQNGVSYVQLLNSADTASAGTSQLQVTSSVAPTDQVVTVGLSNDTMTEITSGLKEGDLVVTQTIASGTASTNTTTSAGNARGGGAIRIPGIGGGF